MWLLNSIFERLTATTAQANHFPILEYEFSKVNIMRAAWTPKKAQRTLVSVPSSPAVKNKIRFFFPIYEPSMRLNFQHLQGRKQREDQISEQTIRVGTCVYQLSQVYRCNLLHRPCNFCISSDRQNRPGRGNQLDIQALPARMLRASEPS